MSHHKKSLPKRQAFLRFFNVSFSLSIGHKRRIYLAIEFDTTAAKLLLQTLNNARMHLAYPALAQVKRHADFFHR